MTENTVMDKKISLYQLDANGATSTAKFQTVASSGTSAQSTAVTAVRVLIVSATAHFVRFGTNPTAVNTDFVLPANTPMQFSFVPGDKVAVITHNGTGHVTIVDLD